MWALIDPSQASYPSLRTADLLYLFPFVFCHQDVYRHQLWHTVLSYIYIYSIICLYKIHYIYIIHYMLFILYYIHHLEKNSGLGSVPSSVFSVLFLFLLLFFTFQRLLMEITQVLQATHLLLEGWLGLDLGLALALGLGLGLGLALALAWNCLFCDLTIRPTKPCCAQAILIMICDLLWLGATQSR